MTSTTARNLFQHLPPPAECLALLIGTAELTFFGLFGLTSPVQWASNFGLPLALSPATPSHKKDLGNLTKTSNEAASTQDTQKALIAALAARNIQNGLLMLVFGAWFRDRKALGVIAILGTVTTATDYLVVRAYGVREAAVGHLVGVCNCILVGGSLLFWGRTDPWW